MDLIWIAALIVGLLTLGSFLWIFAPYFPTRKDNLKTIHKLAQLKPGDKFYELGCGDGKVSHFMAIHNPKATIIGLELFWPVYLFAKIRSVICGRKNFSVQLKNIFWTDFKDADVVYLFGMKDGLNERISKKLQAELKKGSKAISYVFELQNWNGKKEVHPIKGQKTKIYVYTK